MVIGEASRDLFMPVAHTVHRFAMSLLNTFPSRVHSLKAALPRLALPSVGSFNPPPSYELSRGPSRKAYR